MPALRAISIVPAGNFAVILCRWLWWCGAKIMPGSHETKEKISPQTETAVPAPQLG
jgi:hypothetical protein